MGGVRPLRSGQKFITSNLTHDAIKFHSKSSKIHSSQKNFTPQNIKFAPIHNFSLHLKKIRSTNCEIHSIPNFFAPSPRIFAPFSVFPLHTYVISLDNKLYRSPPSQNGAPTLRNSVSTITTQVAT